MKGTGVKYSDVKSTSKPINRENYMLLCTIFQFIHYANLRGKPVSRIDVIFKYGKNKDVAEKVWECMMDLKIEWPHEMYDRIFES